MIEIALATLENAKAALLIVTIILGFGLLVRWCWLGDFGSDDEISKARKDFFNVLKFLMPPAISLACIPSVDQLWEVRIGLIKYHLASPENVQKGAEEILRIGKKLECKYIGCDEKVQK